MSTRGLICVPMAESGFLCSYCGYDSYPSGLGAVLREHYNTADKAAALVLQGDASSVGSSLAECSFYCRDHGELADDTRPQVCADAEAIGELLKRVGAEYCYRFDVDADGWVYFKVFGRNQTEVRL